MCLPTISGSYLREEVQGLYYLDKIQSYLPKGLSEKILSQRDKIEGERKLITVMFCNMEGFTSLPERLGPEEAYGIMDEVYEILIHKVHDYEGPVQSTGPSGFFP